MSHSLSPNNRTSIFGWVKNLKRGSLTSNESLNEVTSDNEIPAIESRSPTKSIASGTIPHLMHLPSHNHQGASGQEFLRPILQYKARSTNNVNRVRSNSFNTIDKSPSIKASRDSFLQSNPLVDENSSYFGVSLEEATSQAAAKISILTNETAGHVLQYGKIPIVVAKCGVYLKQNGLTQEGIFRVGGSSKRVKELQMIFNTPPEFGKKLNWDGYTVHDAASVLRRYLNALPEPLIPLNMYEDFRDPLRQRPRIINYLKYKAENLNKSSNSIPSSTNMQYSSSHLSGLNTTLTPTEAPKLVYPSGEYSSTEKLHSDKPGNQQERTPKSEENTKSNGDSSNDVTKTRKSKNYKKLRIDTREAIDEYKYLVDSLPDLSKQLLFYILDLLAMVQNHSDENLMPSRNLAAIFQPSILSHPNHDMDPTEYLLSQHVVEFLILYAYKLLPNQSNSMKSNNNTSSEVENVGQLIESSKNPDITTDPSPVTLDKKNSTLLEPSAQYAFKRQHSKSMSHSSNHDDLIGFPSKTAFNATPGLDPDTDLLFSDDNELSESELPQMQNLNLVLQSAKMTNGNNNAVKEDVDNQISPKQSVTEISPKQSVTDSAGKSNVANVEIVVTTPPVNPQE